MDDAAIFRYVNTYYSSLIERHGNQPAGVGWNGDASQVLRFEQLAKIIAQRREEPFSILYMGCGYGSLLPFLRKRFSSFTYIGCDLSSVMIEAAKKEHALERDAEFFVSDSPARETDYVVASGIFNIKGAFDSGTWETYIQKNLDTMHAYSKKGFSFNMLTVYSDADKMKENLYYADPCKFFDFCKRRYSRNVSILHDYELYDFTVLVRKLP
jgi:SAM-dependent methyltransferase